MQVRRMTQENGFLTARPGFELSANEIAHEFDLII
jgi:hypothetical protein